MSSKDSSLSLQRSDTGGVFTELQQAIGGRMPALDGLRAFAVLTVLWHNTVWAGRWEPTDIFALPLKVVINAGWVGVQLFFVLSGFLITGILIDEKGAPHQIRNFYARRVLRIFPLYYSALFLLFVVFPALGWFVSALGTNSDKQIWYWTFLANWSIPIVGGPGKVSHFWSLAVEEQFYLVWPFVVISFSNRNLVKFCLALIVSAFFIRAAMISYDFEFAHWRAYEFTFARWDALACGALLAIGVRRVDLHEILLRFARPVFAIALVYVVIATAGLHGYEAVEKKALGVLNQTMSAILFAGLIYFAITPTQTSSMGQRLLSSAPLRNIGKYSYAIYVVHYPVALIVQNWWEKNLQQYQLTFSTPSMLVRVVLVFIISYALALCSWYVIEQPCLRLKRFFVVVKSPGGAVKLQLSP